jgi:hypothetical protein
MITGKIAAFAGGAAITGGVARFLARGSYKTQVLVQDIVGAIFGWCLVVSATVIYPAIIQDPWVFGAVAFLSAYISPALLTTVFSRIDTLDLHVNVGPLDITSNGKGTENE